MNAASVHAFPDQKQVILRYNQLPLTKLSKTGKHRILTEPRKTKDITFEGPAVQWPSVVLRAEVMSSEDSTTEAIRELEAGVLSMFEGCDNIQVCLSHPWSMMNGELFLVVAIIGRVK